MTNREAIEYIERECHTCKGFYAPENECIAVPQDCFESKRLAISALQEREERERPMSVSAESSKIEDIVREVLEKVYRTLYINNTEGGYTRQSIDFNATVSDIEGVAKDYGIDFEIGGGVL